MINLVNLQNFYNSIYLNTNNIEDTISLISKNLILLADDLSIAKIGMAINLPSTFNQKIPFSKKGIIFDRRACENSFTTVTYQAENKGTYTFTIYPNKKHEFSEEEKTQIDFLCKILFVFLEKSILNSTLKKVSERDFLTGIYNQYGLSRIGSLLLEKKYLAKCSVVYMDIKSFNSINRKYGSKIGDEVLKTFAKQLYDFIGKAGFIGRFGGNYFVVIIKNSKLSNFIQFIKKVLVKVTSPDGAVLQETLSVNAGICTCDKSLSFNEYLTRACIAMKISKTSKIQDLTIFDESMMENLEDKLTIKV